jgi:hypothetical protein
VVYVAGLSGATRIVSPSVAEALLEPLDSATPVGERRALLVAAYRILPDTAAPRLAAALDRIDPSVRVEGEDVLETLRHRAPGRR